MNRALVTGGCGFIGSNLVHKLAELGWCVDVADDLSNGHPEFLEGLNIRTVPTDLLHIYTNDHELNRKKDQILVITGDFAHDHILGRVRSGKYDYIFHLAANPRVTYSIERPVETTEVNILKTVALFQASAQGNVQRVVFSSSSSVYGNAKNIPTSENEEPSPESPYALQKLVGEQFAKLFSNLYDLDIVALRYFNVYGPRQYGGSPYSTAVCAWCQAVSDDEPLRSDGDGTQSRDLVYVDDVVHANILAAASDKTFKGDVYNVGSGSSHSNNDILEKFSDVFDIEVNSAPWRDTVMRTEADINRIEEELNFTPQHSLWSGLEETFKWWGI